MSFHWIYQLCTRFYEPYDILFSCSQLFILVNALMAWHELCNSYIFSLVFTLYIQVYELYI